METWIVYDLATGEELFARQGTTGMAAYQWLPEGAAVVVVPAATVGTMPRDLNLLRQQLVTDVDNEAERVRGQFITALPGQVGGYLLKAEAARAWLLDNDDEDAADELRSEADAAGMSIGDLAAEVMMNARAWRKANGAIEGLRRGAKRRIAEATTIGTIVEAAVIDWKVFHASAA